MWPPAVFWVARSPRRPLALQLLGRIEDRAVLVAFVQGIIGALHENPCPFNEAGREKTGEGADEDFLEEGGVHPFLKAAIVPATKVFTNSRMFRSQLTPRFSAVITRKQRITNRLNGFRYWMLKIIGLKPGVNQA